MLLLLQKRKEGEACVLYSLPHLYPTLSVQASFKTIFMSVVRNCKDIMQKTFIE